MEEKPPLTVSVNYLYFGAFFVFLILSSASSILVKEPLGGSRIFFFLYAAGQAALEVSILAFLGWMIRRFLGKVPFAFFISLTFVFLFLHLLDFFMDRILDLSIWETVALILSETLENLFYLFDASGIPLWAWLAFFSLFAALPLFGLLIYYGTEKMAAMRPLRLRREWFLQLFFCLPAALFFWDVSASKAIHPDAYTALLQSLPWKFTFLQPKTTFLSLPGPIRPPLSEKEIAQAIASEERQLSKRPNIYLFIVESLRADCITPEGAPHFERLKRESLQPDLAISNGNGSHISWFSIFHSQFPYCWSELQKRGWRSGSPALHLLKKWGYQIRLYSSAQLGYYKMEPLLFGENSSLLDARHVFYHTPPHTAAETDAQAIEQLRRDIAEDPTLQEGQLYIVFLDSTHFNYSWPENWSPKFLPFARELAYFKTLCSPRDIELVKNRYRNALHYVDSLFGKAIANLPHPEEAILLVSGDHGEEFFERGHLFHNSHLVHEQTHIPLFIKLGSTPPQKIKGVISQMDLFPTLLHYLSGSPVSFLEGRSALSSAKWPYALVARFNASQTPYEFCLHNGSYKLIAQFSNRRNIFQTRELQIRSLRTAHDAPIAPPEDVKTWIDTQFGQAISHLFPAHSRTS